MKKLFILMFCFFISNSNFAFADILDTQENIESNEEKMNDETLKSQNSTNKIKLFEEIIIGVYSNFLIPENGLKILQEEIKKIATLYSRNYSKTLEEMKKHDYFEESITGISTEKIDDKILKENLKQFGELISKGMPTIEYKNAMNYQWQDMTEYNKEPILISIDISKVMNYNAYVQTLKELSRYDGVYLYKIGKSTNGKDLYSIEIDIPSDKNKEVFMFSGQHHSREFAGGDYILKQFADLIQKAQIDKNTMDMLKQYKYVAVPIVSIDAREELIYNPHKWTTSEGQLWKAYIDGTDGNRNYPGLQWGQICNGNKLKFNIKFGPDYGFYAGPYGGSASETKAMMKWFYHYIVVEKAVYYLDYHQQNRVIFAGCNWQTKEQYNESMKFVENLQTVIRTKNGDTYTYEPEELSYGLQGEGSTAADYAVSLAVGSKFSPAYGFQVIPHWGKEYTLMQIVDLDRKWVTPKETNSKFAAVTLEIGKGTNYLGYSDNTRYLIANEYFDYNFDKLLEKLPTFIK